MYACRRDDVRRWVLCGGFVIVEISSRGVFYSRVCCGNFEDSYLCCFGDVKNSGIVRYI